MNNLVQSEVRYRQIVNNLPIGVYVATPDDHIVEANPAFLKMAGYASLEAINQVGMSALYVDPADYQRLITMLQQGPVVGFETHFRRPDGQIVNILISVRQMQEPGAAPYIEGFLEDITDRKHTGEAIRDSEEKLRAIYEGTNDAIMLLTPEGFFDCNPRTLEMFGFKTKEEFITVHPADVSPPFQPDGQASLPAAQERIQTAYERGHTRFDWVHRRTNGQDFPAEVLLSAFDLGGQRVLQATVRDITERKYVEEALRASEAEMRALFAAMTDVILVLDAEGRYLRIAPTNPPLLYRPAATLEGKTLHEILPQPQADVFLGYIRDALVSNQAINFEYSLELESGTTWFAATVSPMVADRVIWVARDITQRKQLEQQIRESLEWRGRQVQTSTEIAQEIAATPALDELFQRVVTLIKDRFDYYHAQIFRYDAAQDAMLLVTGYGEAGEKMLAAGHKLAMGRGVVGTVAATGQSVLAADVAQDADWRPNPFLPQTRGELAVPIKMRDEVLGILDVQSETAGALTAEDQLLLEGLCGQIAIAIDNVRLVEKTQAALAESQSLLQLSSAIISFENLPHLLQSVVDNVAELLPADRISLKSFDLEKRAVTHFVKGGPGSAHVLTDTTFDEFWDGLSGWALRERKPALSPKDVPDPRESPAARQKRRDTDCGAVLVAPLIYRDRVLGTMTAINRPDEANFTQKNVDLMVAMANQAAIAIENARLFEETQNALAEVRQSEELMRTMIDATPDWIFIKDREHRYRLANQGYANALHLRPEDFIGKNDLDLGFPEELVKGNPEKGIRGFWTDDRLVIDTGETQMYPNDPATIDGVVHIFHTIKTPLRDADGHTWGVLAFSRDVTELEQTAEALRRREAQMQETLDELERLNRAATREGWQSFLRTGQLVSAYRYDQSTVQPAQDLWLPQIEQAIQQNALVPSGEENEAAVAPLSVRGTVIGALGVYDDPQRPLSPDELTLLQEILEQGALALENARLYQDAQRRAAREQLVGEVTGRIRETLELEDVLKIAVQEIRQALGADELGARLLLIDKPEPDSD